MKTKYLLHLRINLTQTKHILICGKFLVDIQPPQLFLLRYCVPTHIKVTFKLRSEYLSVAVAPIWLLSNKLYIFLSRNGKSSSEATPYSKQVLGLIVINRNALNTSTKCCRVYLESSVYRFLFYSSNSIGVLEEYF